MAETEVQRGESFISHESEVDGRNSIVQQDEEIFQEVKSKETDFTFKIMVVGDGFRQKGRLCLRLYSTPSS